MVLSSSRNSRPGTCTVILYGACINFPIIIFLGVLMLLTTDPFGTVDLVATPISSLVALFTSAGLYALIRPPGDILLICSLYLSAMNAWSFHMIGRFHS